MFGEFHLKSQKTLLQLGSGTFVCVYDIYFICIYVYVFVQSLDLNKEQTKFRVKLPPSHQPLHHPGVTFPSWRAVIAWPDLDPSGKHQGLPESSYTMLAAKGIRWPKQSLHTGHIHKVIKPKGMWQQRWVAVPAKFPRGRRNLLHLYLPPRIGKMYLSHWNWMAVEFTFIGESLFIQILLMAWYMCVSLYK